MKIHIRYIGEAGAKWRLLNMPTSEIATLLNPESIHLHDFISHPDFPDEWLVVTARHIDLHKPALTLYLDLLPEHQRPPHLALVGSTQAPAE